MLIYIDKGAYWNCEEANIIFNPVSISKSKIGELVFNKVVKKDFSDVYDKYREYMIGECPYKLLGDIQLVQIDSKRFIMNAFIYDRDKLNHKALTKALIEMSNLLEEYHINGSLRSTFGSKNKQEFKDLETIINTVFKDNSQNIFIYKPSKKK